MSDFIVVRSKYGGDCINLVEGCYYEVGLIRYYSIVTCTYNIRDVYNIKIIKLNYININKLYKKYLNNS